VALSAGRGAQRGPWRATQATRHGKKPYVHRRDVIQQRIVCYLSSPVWSARDTGWLSKNG
jgi:hypothetical protein